MDWIDQLGTFLLRLWAVVMLGGLAWAILGSFLERLTAPRSHLSLDSTQCALAIQRADSAQPPVTFHVTGVSHANQDGSSRQSKLSMLGKSDALWLEREPNNPHDPNALRVMSTHGQIGYVPRLLASKLRGRSTEAMSIEMCSTGLAGNGLWGCKVRLTEDTYQSAGYALKGATEETKPAAARPVGTSRKKLVEKDGRAYFDAILLAALNNGLSDILSPEDDLRVCHRSHGEGQVKRVRERQGREALIEVSFADHPDGSGDYSASTFASQLFRGDGLMASIGRVASDKYQGCFSTVRLEQIAEAHTGMIEMARDLSGVRFNRFDGNTRWMDDDLEEYQRQAAEEAYRDEREAGFSWHDYHKHD